MDGYYAVDRVSYGQFSTLSTLYMAEAKISTGMPILGLGPSSNFIGSCVGPFGRQRLRLSFGMVSYSYTVKVILIQLVGRRPEMVINGRKPIKPQMCIPLSSDGAFMINSIRLYFKDGSASEEVLPMDQCRSMADSGTEFLVFPRSIVDRIAYYLGVPTPAERIWMISPSSLEGLLAIVMQIDSTPKSTYNHVGVPVDALIKRLSGVEDQVVFRVFAQEGLSLMVNCNALGVCGNLC